MQHDRNILRQLARRYAEAAQDPVNQERKALHEAVNDLRMVRPVVLIDEVPWDEMNDDGSLTLACRDPYLRQVETSLRRTLYQWEHFPGDMILRPYLAVEKKIDSTGIGLKIREDTLSTDAQKSVASHRFYDQMEDESALQQLRRAKISYDREDTERRCEILTDLVGDILPVRIKGNRWLFNTLWDDVAQLHGVENLLMDLVLRPDFMHAVAEKLTDIYLDKVKQYEALGLFEADAETVHSTPAYTRDLPAKDFDGKHCRARDVWGRGAAQVFSSVSPEQRREFDIAYMKKAMQPFGLVYYGCCEPLHDMIDIVAQIPGLRKISITPWADYDIAAENIGKRYVMACKASPSAVATATMDQTLVRKELEGIFKAGYRHDCSMDLVLKDISSVGKNPENLKAWEKIAMQLARSYGG